MDDITEDYYRSLAEGVCPKCGAPLDYEGGCEYCRECGWSACDL